LIQSNQIQPSIFHHPFSHLLEPPFINFYFQSFRFSHHFTLPFHHSHLKNTSLFPTPHIPHHKSSKSVHHYVLPPCLAAIIPLDRHFRLVAIRSTDTANFSERPDEVECDPDNRGLDKSINVRMSFGDERTIQRRRRFVQRQFLRSYVLR
jgi:hypothetical protein